MTTLAIDIETYSSNDLLKSGVYKYVEAPDFEILLFAFAINAGAVRVVDLKQGETLPNDVLSFLQHPEVLKTAYNANFERTCLAKHFGIKLPANQWCCTMAHAAMLGLPLSLEACANVLNLDDKKVAAGKALIRYFSVPCKPTKANGMRTRNLPEHDPEKWKAFKEYCRQDVVVEQAVKEKISFFQISETEKKLWVLDQNINDNGVLVDLALAKNAIVQDVEFKEKLSLEAVELTGLTNPNSVSQLKEWIEQETEIEVESLNKEKVPELLKTIDCSAVKRVLELRQQMSKTSVKKYTTMVNAVCTDSHVRGLLQYYGANRTGRWAGRLVQVQNLPKNHLKDLSLARECVRSGDGDLLELLYGNVPDVLSQLVRTSFIAPKDHRFIVADFSAIEARVVAWLANERWRMDVFNTHGMIYEASAAQMFKVPMEAVTKGSDLRQKGKVSELALGYQGGPNALIQMGALKMGIPEEELPRLVAMWRGSNKQIVKLWATVQEAAICAIKGEPVRIQHGIKFNMSGKMLFITLPSGRKLVYQNIRVESGRYGEIIVYDGMDQTTKKWGKQETYGGKLVENITQAIARDCLATAMLRLDEAGYPIVLHVHDEVVLKMLKSKGSLEEVDRIMGAPIDWAKGLPLTADSYETIYYYKKD